MSGYNKILSQFTQHGLTESSELSQFQMKRVLDQICMKNANIRQFNPEVAQELWVECDQHDGKVNVGQYVNIIVRAQAVLKENLSKCQQELREGATPERKMELEESIVQYSDDLKILTVPFQINVPTQSRAIAQSRNHVQNSRMSKSRMDGSVMSGRSSGIFMDVPSKREHSFSLKLTFIIVALVTAFEFVLMFHRHHFYNMMIMWAIIAILVMNYFDKHYIKFILVNIIISVVLDLFWLIVMSGTYWNPIAPTQHSTLHTGFLRFIYLFVIFLLIARVFIGLLLFRYRNNDGSVRKIVAIFGKDYFIDGNIKENNPISRIIGGMSQAHGQQSGINDRF